MKNNILFFLLIFFICLIGDEFDSYIENISLYNSDEQLINDSILINNYPDSTINKMCEYLSSNDWTKQYIAQRILKSFPEKYNNVIFENLKNNMVEDYLIINVFNHKEIDSIFIQNLSINENKKTLIAYINYLGSINDLKLLMQYADNDDNQIREYALRGILNIAKKDTVFIELNGFFYSLFRYKNYNTDALLCQIISLYDSLPIEYIKKNINFNSIRQTNNYLNILSYIGNEEAFLTIFERYEMFNIKNKYFIEYLIREKNEKDNSFFNKVCFDQYRETLINIIGDKYE